MSRGGYRGTRIGLARTAPTDRQIQRSRAVEAILKSFSSRNDATDGNQGTSSTENGMTGAEAAEQQQICPVQAVPQGFLVYASDSRPNPVLQPRGSQVLDALQASLTSITSPVEPSTPLYRPQGTHPVTGQALPPLLNNPGRLATGEDTAALSNTIASTAFAFQVINNNYNISAPRGGSLNQTRSPHETQQSAEKNCRQHSMGAGQVSKGAIVVENALGKGVVPRGKLS